MLTVLVGALVGVLASPRATDSIVTRAPSARMAPPDSLGAVREGEEVDTVKYGIPVLYELRLERIAHVTVKTYDSGRDVLVPLDIFCRTAGLSYKLDVSHRTARVGEWTVRLTASEFVTAQGTTYISVGALTRATHVNTEIDRDEAAITMSNIAAFPVARQARRAAARAKLVSAGETGVSADEPAAAPLTVRVMRQSGGQWGGLSVDYSLVSQNTRTTGWSAPGYSLAASTTAAGGALLMRGDGSPGAGGETELSWLRAWPLGNPVAQLQIGDGATSGAGSVWSRGVFVSNAPLVRSATVAVIPLDGTLPADWSVEAYRDGALIAFDSVGQSGRYRLAVPVHYGQNPFDLVAYGPLGETRQLGYVFRALPSLLPAGRFEYAASAGACRFSTCQGRTNADFRYGITQRWSARAGATNYTWSGGGTTVHPYVGMTATPGAGIGFELEAMAAAYRRASLRLDPSSTVSVVGDYTTYDNTRGGSVMSGGGGRNDLSVYASVAPGVGRPAFELQGWRTVDQFGVHGFGRIASAVGFAGGTFRPYWRTVKALDGTQSYVGMDGMIMPAAWGLYSLQPWWVRGTIETTSRGAWSRTEMVLSRSDVARIRVEGGVRWQREIPGAQFTVALVSDLGKVRSLTSMARRADGGETQLVQAASGSLRWDETTGRVSRSADPVLNRAGVAGVVFLDQNGNGRRDPEERPLSGVKVRVDNAVVATDARGHYETWGVIPTELATVSIDTTTLESPWWAPAFDVLAVRTAPNRAVTVDVPIVAGGIVEGRVVTEDGEGVATSVVLANLTTGERRRVETFTDGGFYQMGVAPGRYTVTVQEKSGGAAWRCEAPVTIVVTDGVVTRDVRVLVRAGTSDGER